MKLSKYAHPHHSMHSVLRSLSACLAVIIVMAVSTMASLPSVSSAGEVCDGREGGRFYGPISHGETLWEISRDLRRDEGISVVRMAAAIKRANKHAFLNGDVRRMEVCEYLRLPSRSQLNRLSEQQARAEILGI